MSDARKATAGNGAVTLSATAYAALKERIQTFDLEPGASLSEADACGWLGMSKAPIRDALARLRRDGLVRSAARSGYTVAPITVKDARDLFQLRGLLETEVAGLAAERGHVGQLEALIIADEDADADCDPHDPVSVRRFLSANTAFHLAVADLAGNQRITDSLTGVIDLLERYMHLGLRLGGRQERNAVQHRELVGAIARGDAAGARSVAQEHAAAAQEMVLDGLLRSEAVLTANIATAMVARV